MLQRLSSAICHVMWVIVQWNHKCLMRSPRLLRRLTFHVSMHRHDPGPGEQARARVAERQQRNIKLQRLGDDRKEQLATTAALAAAPSAPGDGAGDGAGGSRGGSDLRRPKFGDRELEVTRAVAAAARRAGFGAPIHVADEPAAWGLEPFPKEHDDTATVWLMLENKEPRAR